MTQKEIGELAYEAGLTEALRVTGEILANTITGGNKDDEEPEKNEEVVSKQTG